MSADTHHNNERHTMKRIIAVLILAGAALFGLPVAAHAAPPAPQVAVQAAASGFMPVVRACNRANFVMTTGTTCGDIGPANWQGRCDSEGYKISVPNWARQGIGSMKLIDVAATGCNYVQVTSKFGFMCYNNFIPTVSPYANDVWCIRGHVLDADVGWVTVMNRTKPGGTNFTT